MEIKKAIQESALYQKVMAKPPEWSAVQMSFIYLKEIMGKNQRRWFKA